MAWTQTDVDALKSALKSGTRLVRYADKTIEYRSLQEMRELLRMMEADVADTAGTRVTRSYAKFSKG